jgi:uncharacterized repeat protein (TIGR01451 family)
MTTTHLASTRRPSTAAPTQRRATRLLALLPGLLLTAAVPAATIVVNSTAANRGSFTELQCLPPGSDVDPGPAATTVTGGATLAAAEADGAVTLREAICIANNTPEPDVIVLASATYTLTTADNYWYGPNGLPPIADDITIEGNGAILERSSANSDTVLSQRFRLFFVSRKTLTDGIAIVAGADRARLRLRDLTLRNGLAQGGAGQSGGGGGGMGGAIFNQGRLDIDRVTFVGNRARGGDSGTGSFLSTGRGGGMGRDGPDGGGFGPGLFGGGLGGAALFDESAVLFDYSCGGGAGFGVAPGGDAQLKQQGPGSFVFAGNGGGLGNVGGSNPVICTDDSETDCSGTGRDGGGGGVGITNTTSGNGRGGSFGQNGNSASDCGGGGGVGGGGGESGLSSGLQAGAGGFGGGGGARLVGLAGPPTAALGGAGGFGGGGGAGYNPDGNQLGVNGPGGFGAGDGGLASGLASGGGGAGLGGALFNHGGEVTAVNSTWSDNRAIGGSVTVQNIARPGAGYGGAIFNFDGILDVSHSTLSDNRVVRGAAQTPAFPAVAGGAVYNRVQNPAVYGFVSRVTIRASVLANSVDGTNAPISDCNHSAHPDAAAVSSQIFTSTSNLFETLATVTDFETHGACAQGSGGILADPQLLPLADNGGLTPTMAIATTSPALNSAGACSSPGTDQRGIARPQGAACDRGAVELSYHSIGGEVLGLAGSGLVLRNNGGNNLPIVSNGPFAFSGLLPEGSNYAVTAHVQPTAPNQTCSVIAGTGTVGRANVTNVQVACVTNQYSVGGTVAGLAGSGLVLQNNGGDPQPVAVNGGFTFTAQDDGSEYDITVAIQPSNLSQTCEVLNGSGTLAGANIGNVQVNCVTNQYTVGGTLSGLNGNQVVLQNNGGDDLILSANGRFSFSAQVDGSGYAIGVLTQPVDPAQTCVVANELGTLAGANVGNVEVICTNDQQATTTTIVGQSPASTVVGETYTVSVLVSAEYESPLGTVTISDGSASCGPVTLVPGNVPESTASCELVSLSVGTRTLTAQYTPASEAFGASDANADHPVNPAVTSIAVSGPARSRINQSSRFDAVVSVMAPGGGTPTGTLTLSSAASSCSVTLPTATPGCELNFGALGTQSVSASFVPSDGNHLGSSSSGAGNASTLVFALADVSVTKSDGEQTYQPGDLIVYTVQVRNAGPDAAAQVRVQDLVPPALVSVVWSCDSSGGASCSPAGGSGSLDVVLASLPVGGLWNYTFYGTVDGAPDEIVNTATLILPADATIEDPNPASNSATDRNLLEWLFNNGFEAPLVSSPQGSLRLPTTALAAALDGVSRSVFRLDDKDGSAAQVYARLRAGTVEYALALRGPDGRWTLGAWRSFAVDPTLSWNATRVDDAWQLTGVDLR